MSNVSAGTGTEATEAHATPPSFGAQGNPAMDAIRLQVSLAFFAFILIGGLDGALGVLLPSVRAFYHIDKSTIGILFLASTSGYILSALASGFLVEKLGRRSYMLLGCVTFAVGALVLALTPPFLVVLLGALCLGFGVAVIDAGLNAYMASMPNSTATLNYLHAFYGIGALLGPVLASGVVSAGLGWNLVYYLWLVLSLLLLVGFSIAFKGQAHAAAPVKEEGNVLLATLRVPVVWVSALFLFSYVGIEVSLGSWAYTFLTEERHEAELISGWTVSGYWLGLTIGRLLMGKLSSKIGARQLINICLGGIVAGLLIVWLLPFGVASAVGLWLVGFSLGPIFPTTISFIYDFVPTRLQASAVGFAVSVGAVGAAIFPAGAGALADALGLWSLLAYEIVLTAVLVVLWLVLVRQSKVSNDLEAHSNATPAA